LGLSLGLYIAREIALAHGGSLEVASEKDAGTTFTVMLPSA
jgi:signal transduction histidine kinase